MMFGGKHARVKEHHDDDEPVERLWFDDTSTCFAAMAIH